MYRVYMYTMYLALTPTLVQEAIKKQSKNNILQGSDKLNIRDQNHIGPLGLAVLTSMFKFFLPALYHTYGSWLT